MLVRIEVLRLDNNRLQQLPEDIGGMQNLVELQLSSNRLQGLPASIGFLRQLQTLDLAKNRLQSLPDLTGLHALKILNARENRLEAIPRLPDPSSLDQLILGAFIRERKRPQLEHWIANDSLLMGEGVGMSRDAQDATESRRCLREPWLARAPLESWICRTTVWKKFQPQWHT